jgi:hypothetical protein
MNAIRSVDLFNKIDERAREDFRAAYGVLRPVVVPVSTVSLSGFPPPSSQRRNEMSLPGVFQNEEHFFGTGVQPRDLSDPC